MQFARNVKISFNCPSNHLENKIVFLMNSGVLHGALQGIFNLPDSTIDTKVISMWFNRIPLNIGAIQLMSIFKKCQSNQFCLFFVEEHFFKLLRWILIFISLIAASIFMSELCSWNCETFCSDLFIKTTSRNNFKSDLFILLHHHQRIWVIGIFGIPFKYR